MTVVKLSRFFIVAMLMGYCLGIVAPPVHAQENKLAAAIEKDFKASGLAYEKLPGKDVIGWIVPVKRPTMGGFPVIVFLTDKTVVTQARVAKKSEINATPALMEGLLGENMRADFVKIGFPPSGDLIVRIDIRAINIDADELKFLVGTVADAADQIAKSAAAFIKR